MMRSGFRGEVFALQAVEKNRDQAFDARTEGGDAEQFAAGFAQMAIRFAAQEFGAVGVVELVHQLAVRQSVEQAAGGGVGHLFNL